MIFDIAPAELLVLGAVALVVIPPKDLPKAMRIAGQWVGRARGMARTFRSGFDDMIRESEFQEMEKKWRAENERIMREFPATDDQKALMAPLPEEDAAPLDPPVEMTPATVEQPAIAPEPSATKPPRKRIAKPQAAAADRPKPAATPAPAATSRAAKAKS